MAEAIATLEGQADHQALGNGSGVVEVTERLYRSLFAAATGFAAGAVAWGMVIAPFNGYQDHTGRSLLLGGTLLALAVAAFVRRRALFHALRRRPALLALPVVLAIGTLWADDGWRSSYYLATYAAIALAAVTAGLRWSLACGGLLAAGYVGGLGINGYSWAELKALNDADSVVANTGGYLIAAFFFAAPVSWLGGYVSRVNQVIGDASNGGGDLDPGGAGVPTRSPRLTERLSVREVAVVQLLAEGKTNVEIAATLVVSPRTVQSHVASAMRKTETGTRTELAVLAVREGLVPLKPLADS